MFRGVSGPGWKWGCEYGMGRQILLSAIRRVGKRFHPEGIPWLGSALYNAVSGSTVWGDKIMRRYAVCGAVGFQSGQAPARRDKL